MRINIPSVPLPQAKALDEVTFDARCYNLKIDRYEYREILSRNYEVFTKFKQIVRRARS